MEWNAQTISGFHVVVIATAHEAVNYEELGKWASCIIDTRNAMAKVKTKDRQVWKA